MKNMISEQSQPVHLFHISMPLVLMSVISRRTRQPERRGESPPRYGASPDTLLSPGSQSAVLSIPRSTAHPISGAHSVRAPDRLLTAGTGGASLGQRAMHSLTPGIWAEKFDSLERIKSIPEKNVISDSCNSCERLETTRAGGTRAARADGTRAALTGGLLAGDIMLDSACCDLKRSESAGIDCGACKPKPCQKHSHDPDRSSCTYISTACRVDSVQLILSHGERSWYTLLAHGGLHIHSFITPGPYARMWDLWGQ